MSAPIQPRPTADSRGYWEATARGELALSWCPACARFVHPPLEACPRCAGKTEYRAVSGRGRIHSFIVVHRAVAPGYADKPGNVVVLVELEEQAGLRLVAQLDLDGVEPGAVAIDAPVETRIVPLPGGDYRMPVFRLCAAG